MRVVADRRERDAELLSLLRLDPDVELHVETLPVGDYLVGGAVLVERKTWPDFSKSIVEARIFRQASGLWRAPQPGVLLLEGAPPRGRVRLGRRQLQGALVTLTLVFQLHLLRARDAAESLWLMKAMCRQASRRAAKGLVARHFNPLDADARRIHLVASIPGVGPGRAARLLERFGTIEAVVSPSESELASVPGIGPRTAAAIRTFVR